VWFTAHGIQPHHSIRKAGHLSSPKPRKIKAGERREIPNAASGFSGLWDEQDKCKNCLNLDSLDSGNNWINPRPVILLGGRAKIHSSEESQFRQFICRCSDYSGASDICGNFIILAIEFRQYDKRLFTSCNAARHVRIFAE
jgi:hypothetical protein